MAKLYRGGMTMQQIGDRYEVSRQTVQQRLASVGITAGDRPLTYKLIHKKHLELLYSEEKLSLDKIAQASGVKREVISQALEFHQTPKREWINTGGSRLYVLKRMKLGDKCQATFTRMRPHSLIYMPAKKLGIKVSMRRLGDNEFEITRIG